MTPKGWRTNDPGAADIPLTWKGGSWGLGLQSAVPSLGDGEGLDIRKISLFWFLLLQNRGEFVIFGKAASLCIDRSRGLAVTGGISKIRICVHRYSG